MNINTFLNYLDKVKPTGTDKWQACCPAHDDKSPSMSVKEGNDGRILVHCFGGCTTDQITGALGLDMTDLFAEKRTGVKRPNRTPRKKLEKALMHELFVLHIAINSRHERLEIHPDDKDREQLAVKRINALLKEIYH